MKDDIFNYFTWNVTKTFHGKIYKLTIDTEYLTAFPQAIFAIYYVNINYIYSDPVA